MPGIYRPRHPERTALYRVLFHNFDRFLSEHERRFEKEYGYFRPTIKEVVERYLDCGNPRSGFALMKRSRLMRSWRFLSAKEPRPIPSKGWAGMIRKVCEVDPLICPRCGSLAVLMAFMSAGK